MRRPGRRSSSRPAAGAVTRLLRRERPGTSDPNLDDAKPPFDLVVDRVTNGAPPMPAFGKDGLLTAGQIQNVAAYVVQSTGG